MAWRKNFHLKRIYEIFLRRHTTLAYQVEHILLSLEISDQKQSINIIRPSDWCKYPLSSRLSLTSYFKSHFLTSVETQFRDDSGSHKTGNMRSYKFLLFLLASNKPTRTHRPVYPACSVATLPACAPDSH